MRWAVKREAPRQQSAAEGLACRGIGRHFRPPFQGLAFSPAFSQNPAGTLTHRACITTNRSAFSSLGKFLERLDPFLADWPDDVPVAVEVRNKNWLVPELFDCLRRHRAAHVLADQVWMPAPLSLVQKTDVVTGPFAYVRLLGDRQAVDALTKTLDHIVIDRGEEVRNDAEAICLLADKVPVLAYVNNHFAGYGPGTAEELRRAIQARA